MKTVWRVNIDYLSRDYDDRMLSVDSPYKTEEEAVTAYNSACQERCTDADIPARVQLNRVDFPDDPRAMGVTTVVRQNF